MSMIRRVGRVFLPFGNFKRMVGWDHLKTSYKNVFASAKAMTDRQDSAHVIKETFDEAVQRLNMSEANIVAKTKSFFRTAILFLVMAVAVFIYALDLLFTGHILATIIALILVVLAFSLAFRDHFWYTQMKQRRLGLSLREWLDYTCKGIKK